jgi:glucuronate isomerase
MMLNQQFMLTGTTAKQLYEKFAKNAPIYDFHCHLSAKDIYEDKVFSDISDLWLGHDHYKWRAMRYAGVGEEYITGDMSAIDKFKAWGRTCEKLIGSPLYHWANMELNSYFGVKEILKERNAKEIYEMCNKKISKENLSPIKMIHNSNVKLICTTDDPVDNLEYHKLLKDKQNLDFKVLPTFRPDKSFQIHKEEYINYIDQLGASNNSSIHTYKELVDTLKAKIRYFSEAGCLLADHSLESLIYLPTTLEEVEGIFTKRLKGEMVSLEEAEKFKVHLLIELASEYRKVNLVMQLHIGAYRNTNTVQFNKLGVDAGYDIMNDFNVMEPLVKILNDIEMHGGLPKTILYTLNSKDNLVLSSIPHCFSEDGVPGKIQFGPAWWFCDHKEGILAHLKSIASQGMLADFVGMLTDSRSFLSYVRHDYFRRILCSYIGELVDNNEFENDEEILKEIVEGISYKNIMKYLRMEE